MPLTPQDVHAKLFTSVRFAKGYDEDEVDAFLDEVEAELTRLLGENDGLRRELAAARAAGAEEPSGPGETEDILRRTLLLAQRTADEAVSEARAEAGRIVAAAHEQAQAVEAEASARQRAMTSELDGQLRALEAQVEQLRAFEREYRSRLRAYLETQLRDLDQAPLTAAPVAASEARSGGAPPPIVPPGASPFAPARDVRATLPAWLPSEPAPVADAPPPVVPPDSPVAPLLEPPAPEPGDLDG